VRFRLDGADLGPPDTTAPYSTTWDTTTATDGSHTLTAVATDAAANARTSTPVTVTVDNNAPTVAITSPATGAKLAGATTIHASAADTVGVASVQFRLDGADLGPPDTTAPYSTAWDTAKASHGSHTLTAIATDAAANARTSAPVAVTVDNRPPPTAPADVTPATPPPDHDPAPPEVTTTIVTPVPPMVAALRAPRLFEAGMTRRAFRRGSATAFRYRVSRDARVRLTIQRRRGRRWKDVASFTRSVRAGRVHVPFDGRVRGSLLAPGSYRARLVAVARDGQRSAPATIAFRIAPSA
jgi:hypothetical protein